MSTEYTKCEAVLNTKGKVCSLLVVLPKHYCEHHEYFDSFSEALIVDIKNNDGKAVICGIHRNWHNDINAVTGKAFAICNNCKVCKKNVGEKKDELVENKIPIEHIIFSDIDENSVKCRWVDKNMEPCRGNSLKDTHYCKFHVHVIDYTEAMKIASKLCKGCNKVKYLEDGCDTCRERPKPNKEQNKETEVTCKAIVKDRQCNFKAGDKGYCNKHVTICWKNEIEESGENKVCVNYVRGCKNVLKIDDYNSCEECRETARKNDKIKRSNYKAEIKDIIVKKDNIIKEPALLNNENNTTLLSNPKLNNPKSEPPSGTFFRMLSGVHTHRENNKLVEDNKAKLNNPKSDLSSDLSSDSSSDSFSEKILELPVDDDTTEEEKIPSRKCVECGQFYPLDKFTTLRGAPSKKCNVICLPKERAKDAMRDRSGRDYKEYEQRPERKVAKKQWKEENYEKAAGYWIDARAKKIENDVEGYLKKEAIQAKKWRDNNPEKQKEINKKRNVNTDIKYNYYKREGENKGRTYELTLEESEAYFLDNCYYCGEEAKQGETLNGIDRKDNNGDYTMDNCVTACNMCNMLKGDLFDHEQFIQACEHILVNFGLIEGELHLECFRDYISSNYTDYKYSANKRNKEFALSELEFYNITNNDCYICGKKNTDLHNNGIDRIDNNIGYSHNNCKACCGTCNYLKNDYTIEDVLIKMVQIYNYHYNKNVEYIMNRFVCDKIFSQYKIERDLNIGDVIKQRNIAAKNKEMQSNKDENIIKIQKITKEEKKDREIIRKQQNSIELRNRYNDEESRKIWAKKIADNREKNRNNIVEHDQIQEHDKIQEHDEIKEHDDIESIEKNDTNNQSNNQSNNKQNNIVDEFHENKETEEDYIKIRNRIRQQGYRDRLNESKPKKVLKMGLTPEEKREYKRIQKQKERGNKYNSNNEQNNIMNEQDEICVGESYNNEEDNKNKEDSKNKEDNEKNNEEDNEKDSKNKEDNEKDNKEDNKIKNKIRQQNYRDKINKNKPQKVLKMGTTPEEKKEYERIRKQKQRENKQERT